MKKILFLMILSVVLLVGCIGCINDPITEIYYSSLSVKNDSSNDITEIEVNLWYYWDAFGDNGTSTYVYDDLSAGEQSEYQDIITGFFLNVNVSSTRFIVILKINYTSDGVTQSVTVFDDGLAYIFAYYPNMSDEEMEKVYLKKDTNNTLVITDDGVELLQGE